MIPTLILFALTAAASPPADFRGHPFGATCSTEPGLSLMGTEGEGVEQITLYTDNKLNIGPVALTDLAYACWRDKLLMVNGSFDDEGDTLLGIFTEHWGTPKRSNPYLDDYIWSGSIFAGLKYRRSGNFTILYGPLSTEWRAAARADAADQAADDL